MGYEKFKRPTYADGTAVSVQTITLSGGSTATVPHATAIKNRGVTFITSTGTGAGWTLTLEKPRQAGLRKTIAVNTNSTVPVTIRTPSSASVFFGSTLNSITFTTVGGADTKTVELISQSSVTWNVISIYPVATTASTYITVAGATA